MIDSQNDYHCWSVPPVSAFWTSSLFSAVKYFPLNIFLNLMIGFLYLAVPIMIKYCCLIIYKKKNRKDYILLLAQMHLSSKIKAICATSAWA